MLLAARNAVPAILALKDSENGPQGCCLAVGGFGVCGAGACADVEGGGVDADVFLNGWVVGSVWCRGFGAGLDKGKEVGDAVLNFVAAKEVGAGARLVVLGAVVALAGAEVKPMVVKDFVGIYRDAELAANLGGHTHNGLLVGRGHVVAAVVEIAEVLNTDGVGILAVDAGRGGLQGTACEDGAVGEGCKVLADVAPTVVVDMVVFHAFLKLKVVGALEVGVAGAPGVVLLDGEDCACEFEGGEPGLELGDGHLGEAVLGFHVFRGFEENLIL